MIDEDVCIERARQGDADAFARLVETYQGQVYRLALRLCGSAADADEIAQDALLAAWRGLPRFRGESRFSTWLYRLTSNAAVDHLRRGKHQNDNVPLETADAAADTAPTPEQVSERAETQQQVRTALLELTPEYRQVLVLRHMEELSCEEIGFVLRLPAGTVKSRINRAKAQLREILLRRGNLFTAAAVLHTDDTGEEDVHHA